jgi:hypothetical protein
MELSPLALCKSTGKNTYAKYEGSITKDDIWLAIVTNTSINTIITSASASPRHRVSPPASDTHLRVFGASPALEIPIMNVHRHVGYTVY